MEFSAADELHLVQYDDGETKWHAIRLEEELGSLTWTRGRPRAAVR